MHTWHNREAREKNPSHILLTFMKVNFINNLIRMDLDWVLITKTSTDETDPY